MGSRMLGYILLGMVPQERPGWVNIEIRSATATDWLNLEVRTETNRKTERFRLRETILFRDHKLQKEIDRFIASHKSGWLMDGKGAMIPSAKNKAVRYDLSTELALRGFAVSVYWNQKGDALANCVDVAKQNRLGVFSLSEKDRRKALDRVRSVQASYLKKHGNKP